MLEYIKGKKIKTMKLSTSFIDLILEDGTKIEIHINENEDGNLNQKLMIYTTDGKKYDSSDYFERFKKGVEIVDLDSGNEGIITDILEGGYVNYKTSNNRPAYNDVSCLQLKK